MESPGLYVHVPFCSSICPYCDFSVTLAGEARRARWESCLLREAETSLWDAGAFDTLYLGGGTPSSLRPDRVRRILDGLGESLDFEESCRLSFEANPEDINPSMLKAWRELGFSMISLGVQSFDDEMLRRLGRKHSGDEAREALRQARESGFETVSVDLIFGLEGQEESAWRRDLETAAGLGVDHLSCYQLTIEGGSLFGRRKREGRLREMQEERQAELYLLAHRVLADHGFEGYEISNFARPGHRSHHNLKYWRGTAYLGLGPAAHSFDGKNRRWWNKRKLRLWAGLIESGLSGRAGEEVLSPDQRLLEELMLGLRLSEGLDLKDLEKKYSRPLVDLNLELIDGLVEDRLALFDGSRLRLSPEGMAIADAIIRRLEVG